ncbi:hypothetical protein FLL45_19670 [Aliikangiella marina]|uniref:GlyGly-CTERM sorting domain-containing protein n=1 Tax=Aliikangiella marina TaxID=1712262 RepID=A0A545T2C9_9GAMM|nr:choice-of-anchor H family protein [Aliikangiella marina]TQV71377.1 hypothetical protein FLL45_19670 [Aliikangiella marina]
MKIVIALIALFASFSIFAASDAQSKRVESLPKASVSSAKIDETKIIKKSSEGVKLTRRTQEKVKRPESLKTQVKTSKKQRPLALEQSKNAYAYSIYDAWTTLEFDYDGDGYFSEFTVTFDVDNSGGYSDIYAEMYLSRDGGPWIHLNTTEVFTIYGNDSDAYSVTTLLNYDFPTGYYDLVIDVYEAGYTGIVATAGPADFYGLQSLPLEDDEHELSSNDTQISYVASTIADDFDRDGFFTALTLEYDIDTLDAGRLVYSEVDLTNVDTFERVTLATEDYFVGNQTEFLDLILETGYQAGWYDIEIRVVDSVTGEVIANAAQEFAGLIQLPLESINYDNFVDNPVVNQGDVYVGDAVIVHESGGGSFGWMLLALFGLIPVRRKLVNKH